MRFYFSFCFDMACYVTNVSVDSSAPTSIPTRSWRRRLRAAWVNRR
jgi:hypothetical protein